MSWIKNLNRLGAIVIAVAILLFNFNSLAFVDLASNFGDSGHSEVSEGISLSDHIDRQNGPDHEHEGGASCHGAVCVFFKIDEGAPTFMVPYTSRYLIDGDDQLAVISHAPPYRPPIMFS